IDAIAGVSVNGFTFDVDAGFPSTGFIGAEFTLITTSAASDYYWNSDAMWVSVNDNGKVRFTSQGVASPVTITATPKVGGTPLTYTFTVTSWFQNGGALTDIWSGAATWCLTQGWRQPTTAEIFGGSHVRNVGTLWSEWGDLARYSGSGFDRQAYWTSDAFGITHHYLVYLVGNWPMIFVGGNTTSNYIVCRQRL
ncbi:hypothetical protein QMX34_004558, partial [Aeromonas hydrophila]|nr:hypothetical protein [Aeromonas hydrophila]